MPRYHLGEYGPVQCPGGVIRCPEGTTEPHFGNLLWAEQAYESQRLKDGLTPRSPYVMNMVLERAGKVDRRNESVGTKMASYNLEWVWEVPLMAWMLLWRISLPWVLVTNFQSYPFLGLAIFSVVAALALRFGLGIAVKAWPLKKLVQRDGPIRSYRQR